MSNWFGKDCTWLTFRHTDANDETGEPELKFCNHQGNTDACEGNCNAARCPLKIGAVERIPAPLPAGVDLGDVLACTVRPTPPAVKPPPAYAVDACRKANNFMVFGGHCDDLRASEIQARLVAVFGQAVVDIVSAEITNS